MSFWLMVSLGVIVFIVAFATVANFIVFVMCERERLVRLTRLWTQSQAAQMRNIRFQDEHNQLGQFREQEVLEAYAEEAIKEFGVGDDEHEVEIVLDMVYASQTPRETIDRLSQYMREEVQRHRTRARSVGRSPHLSRVLRRLTSATPD